MCIVAEEDGECYTLSHNTYQFSDLRKLLLMPTCMHVCSHGPRMYADKSSTDLRSFLLLVVQRAGESLVHILSCEDVTYGKSVWHTGHRTESEGAGSNFHTHKALVGPRMYADKSVLGS